MAFSDFDRSDELANSFQQNLFSREGRSLTFADLRPDRPRLLINTTDLQSGRRFVFCNETFDELNSDLSKYPMAYAVAASSAVPVVLHPVTLRDYSTTFKQFRHLVDGGVADNLGVQSLVDTYSGQIEAARQEHRPDPYPNGAVLIVCDAHIRFNAEISSESDIGSLENLKLATGLTGSLMVGRANGATMSDLIVRGAPDEMTAKEMRENLGHLLDEGYIDTRDRTGHRIRVIYLSLAEVNQLTNLPFGNFSESLNGIGTYYNITDRQAYELYQAAELLVKDKFEQRMTFIVQEIEAGATTQPAGAHGH
jgi:predicted acylesterase/phospholipase RssA